MGNFFLDNPDILFHFARRSLAELAEVKEEGFTFADQFNWAPRDATEATDNYRRVLHVLGQLAADNIAPRAADIDLLGNKLTEDGRVIMSEPMKQDLKELCQADMMGMTLPHRFGGLNFPSLVYTMATEIVSRADASLMNIFGLQSIAETIETFADEDIKRKYIPGMCSGELTGAMVLTEPDAGSDLQSVQLKAWQDEQGQWRLTGVKRFITNGCGDVLLVLGRSEHDITDGRGLSLYLAERGPDVHVRRLEQKMGIHGVPTCELYFDDVPCKLIGERQRGLITYAMAMMNGARVGIAAQSLGIAEAAYRVARAYARKQFGQAIEEFPAVRELLVSMRLDIDAARALTYETSRFVDLEAGVNRRLYLSDKPLDKETERSLKNQSRTLKRLTGMLTPMAKYYASEMCVRVASDALQVLGGSGYMRDYPVERLYRDARITTIYEGTSQLQLIAAVRGVTGGAADKVFEEFAGRSFEGVDPQVSKMLEEGRALIAEMIPFVKKQPGTEYLDLVARKLVDAVLDVYCGYLLVRDAAVNESKAAAAGHWITQRLPRVRMFRDQILSGDRRAIAEFGRITGPPSYDVD
jgi:alkylation response protein AidB-like acyl-CoA dehydrogenase